ncbi:peptidyl-prolyl cis-trans isomerase D [Novosphingobium sp. Rr 2-17]|uniref:peptidylprolyl isomerase n=1 Tax=Novosphingobium sp. Rr 2-17 TaxID=555793 RepID=UPI000269A195|nr:peptidylprolyl isomerase [Novosphingobium sp. Rr 2-17]EIZ80296.1 peptidyl-prolyl cis-trans isomerase D [Novosphingobium sp. Rr 2-17]
MLSFFRSLLSSKVGAVIGLLVLGVIAIAFASGDIAGMHSGGASGSAVATVGGVKIESTLLEQGAKQSLERIKQQSPNATMKMLVDQGGLDQVLDDLIGRTGLYAFGKDNKIIVSDRAVDSEIAQIPGFQGVDGKFDTNTFRQALSRQGISEQAVRDDIRENMTVQELIGGAQFGTVLPKFAAERYATLLEESRTGSVIALPSLLYAPQAEPTDAQLTAFYKTHSNQFVRPERRVVRYAVFGEDVLKNVPAPTDAEIAARFKTNQAAYAAQDNRRITQLIVPTEAAAKAVVAEVSAGKSLEAAATAKGLAAAKLEFFSRDQLSSQFSPAVAQAVFAAPVGKLAAPQKSALGWHVIRVDEDQKKPARTIADVRDELSKTIAVEKRRAAFTDMLAKLEDQFNNGANLPEVAKSIDATVQQTQPITANGQVYAQPSQTAPDVLKPVLATAFGMNQDAPQVAEVERGKTFVMFDVTDIATSAPAPLAQIKNDVKVAWMIDAGSSAAKTAALRMQADMRKGKTVEQVMAASGKKLPPVQQVVMSRPTLSAALRAGRDVPPPISLMFHMAKNTIKVQSAAGGRGWFVVMLKDIVPGKIDAPQLVESTRTELGTQLGEAYARSLQNAVLKNVGVKRNEAAIKAVRDQLAGAGAAN